MAKKSNVNIPAIVVIRVIVFLLIGCISFATYSNTADFLFTSRLFSVKDVMIDTSIQFIDMAELRRLKGRNIFSIDIQRLQAKIKAQYPQIAQLQVVRELPNKIKVLAKKRDSLFQTVYQGKPLVVDTEGVAMYFAKEAVDLPVVQGLLSSKSKLVLGAPIKIKTVNVAIDIIRLMKARPHLAGLKVAALDISNLSKIEIIMVQGMRVIIDQDNYAAKIDMLEMMTAQKKIDFTQLKYIDLRFNEPILKENNEEAIR